MKFVLLINVKMQTIVGILTFMSRKNSSLGLSEPKQSQFLDIFSSPEHEVLMVSYCDQSLSVVRALSAFCFKRLLLQNGWTDFEIILQEGSLDDPLPKLLKPFRSAPLNKMAARAKNRKTFKQLLLLNQKMDFEIIIQDCFLDDPLPKLLKEFRYVEQNGRQGYK